MAQPQEITTESINEWLKKYNRDRDWLAAQLGASSGTVANWLAKGKPRPIPEPTIRLIERLMCDDLLEAPQFSLDEARVIRTAMDLHGYQTFREFVRDAVIGNARRLSQSNSTPIPFQPVSAVADDPAEYKIQSRIELPFYGTVAAGAPGGPLDVMDGTHPVPGDFDPSTHYVLRVNGRSMEPEYLDGQFIVCRKLKDGEFATKGQDVISSDASGAYLKRLVYTKEGKAGTTPRKPTPHLVSINPEFPEVVPVADCPIVAVVVAKI